MSKIQELIKFVLEEMDKVGKKYDFSKEFTDKEIKKNIKSCKNDNEALTNEPKDNFKEEDPLLRKIKEIEDGDASIEELEKLIKEKKDKTKK